METINFALMSAKSVLTLGSFFLPCSNDWRWIASGLLQIFIYILIYIHTRPSDSIKIFLFTSYRRILKALRLSGVTQRRILLHYENEEIKNILYCIPPSENRFHKSRFSLKCRFGMGILFLSQKNLL